MVAKGSKLRRMSKMKKSDSANPFARVVQLYPGNRIGWVMYEVIGFEDYLERGKINVTHTC